MWPSPEYPPTNSQTTNWLEEEDAFLDEVTFNHQATSERAIQSEQLEVPYVVSFVEHGLSQNERNYSPNQIALAKPALALEGQRSTMEVPETYRPIFGFSHFNRMQSEAMDKLLHSDENVVISAPTGAGKTALLELAMVRCLSSQQQPVKMVYLTPTKSLCAEKVKAWTDSFGPLGIKCSVGQEFTGDSDYATLNAIKNIDIIATTPEKWDSMTRRWTSHNQLIKRIKLIMIDEIHILKETRGAVLEVCVSRMKTLDHKLRFVAISATVPNLEDITAWLNASALTFSEDYRLVRLDRFVYGYPLRNGNVFGFEKSLDWKLLDIIIKHSEGKPVLIFCSTRGSTQAACDTLLKHMNQRNMTPSEAPSLDVHLKNKKLSTLVPQGIGFHHAGLEVSDRRMVEKLFLERQIRIVATTSTLAVGVNLPAHLVIIKSTKGYQNGTLEEYSDIDILQMIGRAGRPGLDTSGCAAIMTTTDMESKLNALVSCNVIIESSLHQNMTEHLMSEICIGTIVDVESSINWLESTFLCIRINKNPGYYQHVCSASLSPLHSTHQIMHDICLEDMTLLLDYNLVYLRQYGLNNKYKATFFGIAMDRYYIKFKTMIKLMETKNLASIKDVIELVSQAAEFANYRYNANEKTVLNNLRTKPDIRFPIKDKMSGLSDKVCLVIQCVLGDVNMFHPLLGNSLVTASHTLLEKACRITRCIIDCAAYEKHAIKLKHSLDLYRCMKAKMWSNTPFVLKQIEGIGLQSAKALAQKNISSFQQLRNCDPGHLEMILHRNPPFGTKIKDHLSSFPSYYLDLQQKPSSALEPTIELFVIVGLSSPLKILATKYGKGSNSVLWIETSDHLLIDYRRIWTRQIIESRYELTFSVQVTSPSMLISCHVQSEDYVGIDTIRELKPEVDSMRFITLNKNMADPLDPIPLGAQDDYTIGRPEPFPAGEHLYAGTHQDVVAMKAEFPETKTNSSALPGEKPCKHQCKDKRRCKHQCCKRGTNDVNRSQALPTNDAKLSHTASGAQICTASNNTYANSYSNSGLPGAISPTIPVDRHVMDIVTYGGESRLSSPSFSTQQTTGSYLQITTSPLPPPGFAIRIDNSSRFNDNADTISTQKPSPALSTISADIDMRSSDGQMDDILYSVTMDAERTFFRADTGFGTTSEPNGQRISDLGREKHMNVDISINDMDHTMHHNKLAEKTTFESDTCEWVWHSLAVFAYDKASTSRPHSQNSTTYQNEPSAKHEKDNETGSSALEGNTDSHGGGNVRLIPNLTKWLHSHVTRAFE